RSGSATPCGPGTRTEPSPTSTTATASTRPCAVSSWPRWITTRRSTRSTPSAAATTRSSTPSPPGDEPAPSSSPTTSTRTTPNSCATAASQPYSITISTKTCGGPATPSCRPTRHCPEASTPGPQTSTSSLPTTCPHQP